MTVAGKLPGGGYPLSAKLNETGSGANFAIGQDGQTIKAGTYTIRYSVYTSVESDIYKASDALGNKISIDGTHNETWVWSKTSSQTIDKKGSYADGEINWTVTLNKGADIVKYLDTPAHFTDTIPDGLELDGDVEVKQFDAEGRLQGTTTATVDGKTITYDTPIGQYYYVITYKTKVSKETEIPIGGKDFVNTGKTTGGLDGSHDGTVTVPNKVVSKTRISQSTTSENEKTFAVDTWETKIDVHGSLAGYTYTDYAEAKWSSVKNAWISPIVMSNEQRSAIVVRDSAGNVVDSDNYTVEPCEHISQGVDTGLFKLTFIKDVSGPVTVSYKTTTVDAALFPNDTARNWAEITDGKGHSDRDSADTEKVEIADTSKLIWKFTDNQNDGTKDNANVDLNSGKNSLPWTLWLNQGKTLTDDLTVIDTLPEGTTLDESTLRFHVAEYANTYAYADGIHTWGTVGHPEQITYSYDATTRKLSIRIPRDAYVVNGKSLMILVAYSTPITDRDLLASDKGFTDQDRIKFTNNATLDQGGSKTNTTFTENVKRYAVDKHGAYDQASGKLNYSVTLNPDGARLNNGDPLTVKDTMNAGVWQGKVSLDSVKLFTAVNVDGKIQPGALVKEFTVGDHASLDTYLYDSSANSFTIKIADSTGYVLVTSYSVLDADAVASDIKITNTVELQGQKTWNKTDQSSTIKANTSGEVSTGEHFLLVKHDKALFNKTLAGASYTLESYVNGVWSNKTTLTTNANGQALYPGTAVSQGIRNTLYRLVETKAPSGYELDSKPYYFYLVDTDRSFTVPDSVNGDSDYDPSQVVEYRLAKDKNAMLTLDRYDEELRKPQPGQIRVTKIWKDENGKTLDDPVALAKMPTVSVVLTKHVSTGAGDTTDTVIGRKQLNAGNNWTCVWNDLPADGNITYSVAEEAVEGYRASYRLDGQSSSGLHFTLRQEGDLIEVSNTPKSNAVTLPSTGGIGDGWFIGGGLLGVAIAMFGLAESMKHAKRCASMHL